MKIGDLVGKIAVAVGNCTLKHGIGIVQLLKLLCDGCKVKIKCGRNRNVVGRHREAVLSVAVRGQLGAVAVNAHDVIAKLRLYRNCHGLTDGRCGEIGRERASGDRAAALQ